MLSPYRMLALIEPERPAYPCPEPYRGPGQCSGCAAFSPHPTFFYAQIGGRPRPRRASVVGLWVKVVSLLTLVFLATSTATTMAMFAWSVAAVRRANVSSHKAPPATPVTPPARPPESAPGKQRAAANKDTQAPRTASGAVFALSALGRPTHAPEELFRRAKALSAAGIDLLLTETRITASTIDDIARELTPSARIAPALVLPGIRIWSLPPGSLARAAGLTEGDLVTAVNGYILDTPDAALAAYTSLRQGQTAVIELLRAGRHMVIKVDWAQAAPPRPRLPTSMSSIL